MKYLLLAAIFFSANAYAVTAQQAKEVVEAKGYEIVSPITCESNGDCTVWVKSPRRMGEMLEYKEKLLIKGGNR